MWAFVGPAAAMILVSFIFLSICNTKLNYVAALVTWNRNLTTKPFGPQADIRAVGT